MDKWYLKDWSLLMVAMFIGSDVSIKEYDGFYIMRTGFDNGYKMYFITDNGGELNIDGIGFTFVNSIHSMPLPTNGSYEYSNEDVVAYRINCWINNDEIDYNYKSDIDKELMKVIVQ